MNTDTNYITPEEHEITAVKSEYGNPIPFYDNGFGNLYIYRTADFMRAIVRAQSWYMAWEIIEDEILQPIPQDEVHEAYGYFVVPENPLASTDDKRGPWYARHDDNPRTNLATFDTEQKAIAFCLQHAEATEARLWNLVEGYSYQSNATGSGIVYHCLNGESLDLLTVELLKNLGWIITTREIEA